jgi:DNA-binding transcriptional MerR regulator
VSLSDSYTICVRISELASATGVSVPTIKYYLREGLLPPGDPTAVNQADYGDTHVHRLSLIRALIDVGGLSVATAKDVLAAVDAPGMPLAGVFGRAQRAVSQADLYVRPSSPDALARVDEVILANRWKVSRDNPGRTAAANVIDAFVGSNHGELLDLMDHYAGAALAVANADLDAVARQPDVSAMADTVVAGTVLGDALFAALRRIAQEHVTSERFPVANDDIQRHLSPQNRNG